MISTILPKEAEETIFLQAIDQIYENYRKNSESSDEELLEDVNDEDIKINFDFINFSEETLKSSNKKLKECDGILSNSSLSSGESTEIESCSNSPFSSTKFLTEKKFAKIKDFLQSKFLGNLNSNLAEEIQKQKENLRATIQNQIKTNKPKTSQFEIKPTKSFHLNKSNQATNNNNNNNLNPAFNFNVNYSNYNYNFPQHQLTCNNYYGLGTGRNMAMNINNINMMCNNYQLGFFQKQINNKNFEPSFVAMSGNCRKNSYPNKNSLPHIYNNFFLDNNEN